VPVGGAAVLFGDVVLRLSIPVGVLAVSCLGAPSLLPGSALARLRRLCWAWRVVAWACRGGASARWCRSGRVPGCGYTDIENW